MHCLYELYRQFQTAFEFNEGFLIFLLDSVYDSRFGDFVFNNEKERSKVMIAGTSIFTHINKNSSNYLNKFFVEKLSPIYPNTETANLWMRYMLRWNFAALKNLATVEMNVEKLVENDEWELETSHALWLPDLSLLGQMEMLSFNEGMVVDSSTSIKHLTKLKMLVINKNQFNAVRIVHNSDCPCPDSVDLFLSSCCSDKHHFDRFCRLTRSFLER